MRTPFSRLRRAALAACAPLSLAAPAVQPPAPDGRSASVAVTMIGKQTPAE